LPIEQRRELLKRRCGRFNIRCCGQSHSMPNPPS
jgi:hypothetical protein